MSNDVGRPIRSQEDIDAIFRKIEPYLKMGLSIPKSCIEAGTSKSVVYEVMGENEDFKERIAKARQHQSVIISSAIVNIIYDIVRKLNPREGMPKEELTKGDREFLKWYALNSKVTKEEFGTRTDIEIMDPENEIKKIKDMIASETSGNKFSDNNEPPTND